jgi:hypothetical protein
MISEDTSLEALATIVSEALERAGIIATLSGGAAVSIYSSNRYVSEDLDFVTNAMIDELERALAPLGFCRTGRPRLSVFEHPAVTWYLEFPPGPLGFGSTYVDPSHCQVLKTAIGQLRIISPTHCVMDRLIAAVAWDEPQSLEQAVLVAEAQRETIDWAALRQWLTIERIEGTPVVRRFLMKLDLD